MLVVINAGSSSVKFSVYDPQSLDRVESGQAFVRDDRVYLQAQSISGQPIEHETLMAETEHDRSMVLLHAICELLADQFASPQAIVHRVVHGGETFSSPVVVTAEIREQLELLIDLAPLHQPVNLAGIDVFAEAYPGITQIACFDTAFHVGQSLLETSYALPESVRALGVRKYGFHGLSYNSIVDQLPSLGIVTPYHAIICHLGNGASICAVDSGRSVASTMGFTAVEGLPMGTRSGRIDPGAVLYLMDHCGWTTDEVEHLLYHDSGLKGLSGMSSDVRTLEEAQTEASQFALEYFAYRINGEIGQLTAILGGVDTLVFTGGIGEHSARIRAMVCHRLSRWLPIAFSESRNLANETVLHDPESSVRVLRIETDENGWMARAASRCIESESA